MVLVGVFFFILHKQSAAEVVNMAFKCIMVSVENKMKMNITITELLEFVTNFF